MGCGTCTLKFLVIVQCFLIWVAASLLLWAGSEVMIAYTSSEDHVSVGGSQLVVTPAVIVLVCGSSLFLVGLLGIIGACTKNKCLLGLFFFFLLVVVLLELVAAIVAGAYSYLIVNNTEDFATNAINGYWQNDTEGDQDKNDIDFIQEKFQCCGAHGWSDWLPGNNLTVNITDFSHVPESCCIDQKNCTVPVTEDDDTSEIYTEGCIPELKEKIHKYSGYIIGVAVAIAVVQILGLVSTCVLLCKKKEEYTELTGSSHNYA